MILFRDVHIFCQDLEKRTGLVSITLQSMRRKGKSVCQRIQARFEWMKHFRDSHTQISAHITHAHKPCHPSLSIPVKSLPRPDSFIFLELLLSSTQVLTSITLFRKVKTLSNLPMSAHEFVRTFCCQMVIDRPFSSISSAERNAWMRRDASSSHHQLSQAKSLFNLLLYLLCSHPPFPVMFLFHLQTQTYILSPLTTHCHLY